MHLLVNVFSLQDSLALPEMSALTNACISALLLVCLNWFLQTLPLAGEYPCETALPLVRIVLLLRRLVAPGHTLRNQQKCIVREGCGITLNTPGGGLGFVA